MKECVKLSLIFLSGAAVGSLSTFLAVRKTYEIKADLEVSQVKDAYERKLNQIDGIRTSLAGHIHGPEEIPEDKIKMEKTRSSLVNKLNNKPPLKDYTKFFTEKGEIDGETVEDLHLKETIRDAKEDALSDGESRNESVDEKVEGGLSDEEKTIDEIDKELNGAHREAIKEGKGPNVIDKADYELTCDHYDKISLLYYIYDDVVCEENGIEEVNRYDIVGNLIEETGFNDNEDEALYVRNDRLQSDFELIKVYTRYGE